VTSFVNTEYKVLTRYFSHNSYSLLLTMATDFGTILADGR